MWWQTGSIANMTGNGSLAMDLRAPRDSFCKATLLGPVWGLSGACLGPFWGLSGACLGLVCVGPVWDLSGACLGLV